ncbi:DUF3108 domain-containing protein [Bacteroidota bacterium]
MQYKLLILYVLIFNFTGMCLAQNLPGPGMEKNNFMPGEKMVFQVYYGPLNAGRVDTYLKLDTIRGKNAYYAEAVARTTGLADKLYKIRDMYAGYFDPESLLPIKSIRDIREGNYRKFNIVEYHHDSLKAVSSESGDHEIPGNIRDMVSVFYYVRTINFDTMKYDDIIDINTFFDDELFPFNMRFRGRETIRTRGGTFRCIKLVPFVEPGRIFKKEDDMILWFSDDGNCAPVRGRFDLIVGSVKCDLIEWEGFKY